MHKLHHLVQAKLLHLATKISVEEYLISHTQVCAKTSYLNKIPPFKNIVLFMLCVKFVLLC